MTLARVNLIREGDALLENKHHLCVFHEPLGMFHLPDILRNIGIENVAKI